MRNPLWWIAVMTAIVAVLVVWVLPWLRNAPWAKPYLAAIDPVAIALWKKSESILWARWLQLIGLLVPLLQFIGAIDITPYLAVIPAQYHPYLLLFIFVCGQIGEWLRKDTTKPLEVVALPEEKPRELELAVAKVEAANTFARAEVQEAKAKGEL